MPPTIDASTGERQARAQRPDRTTPEPRTLALLRHGGYNVDSIRIKHLLQHTSGLYDYAGDPAFQTFVVSHPRHRWTRSEQVRRGAMDDVAFGYVYDFGGGEEWVAERGAGARLNDAPLAGDPPKDRIELLALEATRTDLVAVHAPPLVGLVHRLRIFGSLALSLCHLADGRVDAVCSLKPARSVDIAAAQLLVRERGLSIELPEKPPFGEAPLDLEGRSRVVAAGMEELCAQMAAALSA